MEDLRKVNSLQLYSFWKNLSVCLLVVVGMMTFSRILAFYFAPIISLLAAGALYTIMYSNRSRSDGACSLVTYAMLCCVIVYTIATIALNVLTIWDLIQLPKEFLFLNSPYIPTLLFNPVCFFTLLWIYIRRNHLSLCRNCKLKQGGLYERGKAGVIFKAESIYQLKNLIYLFGILSVLIWAYYQFVYITLDINARDWYVFTWLNVISFIIDEVYFIYRYYNLYLDLKESDEIISQEELQDMMAKTYLRYYVICDNYIYLDTHTVVPHEEYKEVIDTPFITKRSVNGIPLPEVRTIIRKLTETTDGELRFFFGRKVTDIHKHSVLRYFYFLDGKPEDYPDLPVEGEWVDFDLVKRIYSRSPGKFSSMMAGDISRLATIILTEKIFDEEGRRKTKIRSYNPSFNLHDVRASQLDFQDDKWVRISMFNSDTPFYRIKKMLRGKNAY